MVEIYAYIKNILSENEKEIDEIDFDLYGLMYTLQNEGVS